MPRTLVEAAAFVLGLWIAIELVQPLGLVGPRGLATRGAATPSVSAPPSEHEPSPAAPLVHR